MDLNRGPSAWQSNSCLATEPQQLLEDIFKFSCIVLLINAKVVPFVQRYVSSWSTLYSKFLHCIDVPSESLINSHCGARPMWAWSTRVVVFPVSPSLGCPRLLGKSRKTGRNWATLDCWGKAEARGVSLGRKLNQSFVGNPTQTLCLAKFSRRFCLVSMRAHLWACRNNPGCLIKSEKNVVNYVMSA